jgi:polyisoprenoid-binding protein YceI
MFLISPHRCRRVAAAAVLILAGCTPLPPPAPVATPLAAPAAAVAAAPAATPVPAAAPLQIDSAASLIAVTVRRGGVLARLGHDHVVAARTITGTVTPAEQRAQFQFRLDQLTVDEPALRAIAGLDKQPSQDAIDGTRTNMLTRVLDADRYPLVQVRVTGAGPLLRAAITLHGVTRDYDIPVAIDQQDGSLTATGTVNLKQTDFGLVPFSVMGGAMAVQDQLELRFTLVAR